MEIILITLFCFFINIPFGMWRSTLRKFSPAWFVAVHLPVPFVVILRIALAVKTVFIPLFLAASIVGQFVGGYLRKRLKKYN